MEAEQAAGNYRALQLDFDMAPVKKAAGALKCQHRRSDTAPEPKPDPSSSTAGSDTRLYWSLIARRTLALRSKSAAPSWRSTAAAGSRATGRRPQSAALAPASQPVATVKPPAVSA